MTGLLLYVSRPPDDNCLPGTWFVLPQFLILIPSLRLGRQFIGTSGFILQFLAILLALQLYSCAIHGFLAFAMTPDSFCPSFVSLPCGSQKSVACAPDDS
jgi:hypothetical protein